MTSIAFLLWPDTFEDWYGAIGLSREDYLTRYEGEWSVSLARALAGAGVDVHLIHGTLAEEEVARHGPSGATVHFVRVPVGYRVLRRATWAHRWWNRTQPLWAAAPVASTLSPRLLRRIVALRPDAVVVQDYETVRFDAAAPLLRLAGCRVVGMDTGGSARPSRMPWKPLSRGCAHALLAVHDAEAERLRTLGHDRVAVWPAPVRTDVFRPGDRQAARAALGVAADARVVFAAGRLHPVKNLPLLADACADAGATLVLAGEGSQRGRLERRPNVRLLGWCGADQLVDWYAAADVAALASTQEGQPIALLEALACARAIVATAVGGVPDVVRPGETGWLVRPRDRGALAAALDKALTDPTTADRYGATGRALVLRRHSAAAVGRSFSGLVLPPG